MHFKCYASPDQTGRSSLHTTCWPDWGSTARLACSAHSAVRRSWRWRPLHPSDVAVSTSHRVCVWGGEVEKHSVRPLSETEERDCVRDFCERDDAQPRSATRTLPRHKLEWRKRVSSGQKWNATAIDLDRDRVTHSPALRETAEREIVEICKDVLCRKGMAL